MSLPRTPFSTSLSRSSRETELRIRSIFEGPKRRPPLWLMVLTALSILLCGSLVSCQPQNAGSSASSASRPGQASPLISMETQYYDLCSNYIEIPALVMPDGGQPNQAIAAINQELDELREEYLPILTGEAATYNPFGDTSGKKYCLFYPSTTARYLNLVLFQKEEGGYDDGDIRTWVYDLEEKRPVTEEEALGLAEVTREGLFDGLGQALQSEVQDLHTLREGPEIQGFRIREDGSVVFYLWAGLQAWEEGQASHWCEGLYVWQDGAYTRYDCMSAQTALWPLVPAEETDQLSPALWCQWYFSGEVPGELTVEEPDFYSLDPVVRNAYANVLSSLLEGGLGPDGAWPVELANDPEANRFAVQDVDGDGQAELVLLYAASIYAGYTGTVLAYDGDTGAVRSELMEFPLLKFYQNGVVLAGCSHNQGWGGRFWPYNLHQYDAETDSYVYISSVDAWDRWISDNNEGFPAFPTELDVSGTDFLYYIEHQGYHQTDPVDAQVYYSWLNTYIGGSQELTLSYLPLTTENILRLRSDSPPPAG